MKKNLLTLFTVLSSLTGFAQVGKDSVLLMERAMDRPITLHAGQIRATGGYIFSAFNRRFDEGGNSIGLISEGLTKVRHQLIAELLYGITDHIQVSTRFALSSESERTEDIYIIASPDPSVLINTINERKGLEDIYAGIDLRVPLNTRKVDIGLSLGAFIPAGKSAPGKPEHVVTTDDEDRTIQYHYVNHWGKGVPVLAGAFKAKYRGRDWAATGWAEYKHGLGESSSKEWKHQLYETGFEYYPLTYALQLPDELRVHAEFEYQAFPWVDTMLGLDFWSATGGWSEQSGQRKPNSAAQLVSIQPGFDILVSARLWIRQGFSFTLAGKNEFAPFFAYTTVSYNFFP